MKKLIALVACTLAFAGLACASEATEDEGENAVKVQVEEPTADTLACTAYYECLASGRRWSVLSGCRAGCPGSICQYGNTCWRPR